MISLLGVGEAIFSITARGEDYIQSSIKRTGLLTEAFHRDAAGAADRRQRALWKSFSH